MSTIRSARNYFKRRMNYPIDDTIKRHERVALIVLEKRIPKKPIADPPDSKFQHFHCPACKNRIISRLGDEWFAGRLQQYCDVCGQALDWSDTK